ncbi:helix-turn-helix domain-containing protein [Streptacidiphilus fuscans]|uniref:Helix-turn-helix transcriptional regulator n=1 Tax=Streptacidiphilus fuscans TaxID=2789292 RepID=A0A931FFP5_9ACTN|nr:helix-turn-helix domain-containing protein [Streptacidiphilus fuscans]MBF9071823.1 helix-turn-helix transcriptional regulator [Streptacidiphilus fuscans]
MSFAERLDALFHQKLSPTGSPYTNAQVAEGVQREFGVKLSTNTVQSLRTGARENPKQQTIKALADWFGVPVGYFFGDFSDPDQATSQRPEPDAATAIAAAAENAGVLSVALRADGLSEEGLRLLTQVIDQVRRAEGLPAVAGHPAVDAPAGLDLSN